MKMCTGKFTSGVNHSGCIQILGMRCRAAPLSGILNFILLEGHFCKRQDGVATVPSRAEESMNGDSHEVIMHDAPKISFVIHVVNIPRGV